MSQSSLNLYVSRHDLVCRYMQIWAKLRHHLWTEGVVKNSTKEIMYFRLPDLLEKSGVGRYWARLHRIIITQRVDSVRLLLHRSPTHWKFRSATKIVTGNNSKIQSSFCFIQPVGPVIGSSTLDHSNRRTASGHLCCVARRCRRYQQIRWSMKVTPLSHSHFLLCRLRLWRMKE